MLSQIAALCHFSEKENEKHGMNGLRVTTKTISLQSSKDMEINLWNFQLMMSVIERFVVVLYVSLKGKRAINDLKRAISLI